MFRPQILGRSGPAITVSFLSNLLFSYYLYIYIYRSLLENLWRAGCGYPVSKISVDSSPAITERAR